MNQKIAISIILSAVILSAALIYFFAIPKISRLTESLNVSEFQRLEEGAYTADILDPNGRNVANIRVEVSLQMPITGWVPLTISIWHIDGTKLESLMVKISGEDFMPIYLESLGVSPWPPFHFNSSEDGQAAILHIEYKEPKGIEPVDFKFVLSPSPSERSFQLQVEFSMCKEGGPPLTIQEARISRSFPLPEAREPVIFYVSPDGDDRWSGRMAVPNQGRTDGPFQTILRARDAIRELKEREGGLKNPVMVMIRGGIYWLDEPLIFTAQDSGTEKCPITYQAYSREKPILSGGCPIKGWKEVEVDGKKLWAAEVPEVKAGVWYFRQLFVNGERRPRVRIPSEGFFHIAELLDIKSDTPWNEGQTRFKFEPGEIKAWSNLGDVEVVVFHGWSESRLRVASVDEASRVITFTGPTVFRLDIFETHPCYYVENVFEGLDEPGEWYLDRQKGIVYYLPLDGEDLTKAQVIAPKLEQLVRFEGDMKHEKFVEHLRLRGLYFFHTEWQIPDSGYGTPQAAVMFRGWGTPGPTSAIYGEGVRSCSIEGCTVAHLGTYGIEFGRGCKNNYIVGNEICDLGAGGIKIGEALPGQPKYRWPMLEWARVAILEMKDIDEASDNIVSDNHICNGGRIFHGAVGIWVGQSSDNKIAHNNIHDFYYTGISVGWTWGFGPTRARRNIVEYNHIHHIVQGLLSDAGGIYVLGVQAGTVIKFNLIHDVYTYLYGGWGIYLDEGSSYILVENNVVYHTKSGGFHLHYGESNTITNNIFALAITEQIVRTRPHAFAFQRNIVYWKEGSLLGGNWEDEYSLYSSRFDYNIYFDASGRSINFAGYTLKEWREFGLDVHSVIADPLFADPEHGDFTLKPESPAYYLGFKPIDIRQIGSRLASATESSF